MVAGRVIIPRKHPLVNQMAAAMKARCRVKQGDSLLLAVSGGADSMALLRAMAELAPKRGWHLRLAVAHVQHHLRPARQAEADAKLVRQSCRRLGLPFLRADLDGQALRAAGNLEAAARRARYQALADLARQAGIQTIVTAHHGDDQLETLLMRLVRGTSVAGLRGMGWRQKMPGHSDWRLIRPLLAVDRQAILDYLALVKQPWRQDATNGDLSRWRARLRKKVLPELRLLRPDAAGKAVALADHCRQADRVIARQIRQAYQQAVRSDAGGQPGASRQVDRAVLAQMPALVIGGLLRRLLIEAGAAGDSLGRRQLNPLIRMVRDRQGGRRQLVFRPGICVTVTRQAVSMTGRVLA